jgi:excinuclease ABC subunit A
MSIDFINITKAKVHNLKAVSLKIPKNKLIVITGPSGSGKSSLAFDTIYVEGQRRYIESLSSYARQFLGQFQPPDVESITGLSPAIAIDQKTSNRNPRSTVGTITEVYDYLRVLFARVGVLYCPINNEIVRKYSPAQISAELYKLPEKSKIQILAPVVNNEKGNYTEEIRKFISMGFIRARINKKIVNLDEDFEFIKDKKYSMEIVVDRVLLKKESEKRIIDSIEYALKLSNGIIKVLVNEDEIYAFSEHNMAPLSGIIYPDLEPRLFSFNSPLGACPECNGLGESKVFTKKKMILDESLSVLQGAIKPLSKKNNFLYKMVINISEQENIDLKTPLNKLSSKFLKILFDGSDTIYQYKFKSENSNFEFKKSFPGLSKWLSKKYHETGSERVRKNLQEFMDIKTCPLCSGERLNDIARSVLIKDKTITELANYSIEEIYSFFKEVKFTGDQKTISDKLLTEIKERLRFLNDVGLSYLSLNRSSSTLSGGEGQRIRLATQIGSALSGVLYVLDEPSIGLHQRDNLRLIQTLKSLRDIGNTVIVVEHDEDTMKAADYIIDIGPGAGIHGGEIVCAGPIDKIIKNKNSITGKYLSKKLKIESKSKRTRCNDFIELSGATHNNLHQLDVKIPKKSLVCISGVSGSGKSTLVHEVLVPAVKKNISGKNGFLYDRNNYNSIIGIDDIKSVVELDQSPIGRTPNSNPATYTGIFDEIRKLYAQTPESQIRGYLQGRFSFNVKGGRCDECEGNGVKKIEMHFLPDVYITCSICKGKRYNNETLSVLYKGKNIAEILDLTIEEACEFFKHHGKVKKILDTLNSVGLGYIKLGQPATTLSGGEAQRLKLSRELSKRIKGHCLYILDEPTTGLHFQDISILLDAIQELVDQGHSVVVIEHNLDVIKSSDYIIDLGPEGGDHGGEIVAMGSPDEIIKNNKSHTATFLKKLMK